MNRITLTNWGKEILASNTLQGDEVYWVGYFGLAYVPSPDDASEDSSKTTLVGGNEAGDYIYNLWQGDLLNAGSAISDMGLNGITLYDRNLTSNFRYVFDQENGNNRLVTWTTDDNSMGRSGAEIPAYVRKGYHIYDGVTLGDGNNNSDVESTGPGLPCPAPLIYINKNDYGGSDWPYKDEMPFVTPDMRYYPANTTRDNGEDCLDDPDELSLVSEFNKRHGFVSSEGYGMNMQESCHNMSRVTKLFPISSYELMASGPAKKSDGTTAVRSNDAETVIAQGSDRGNAKSIKYHLELNLRDAYQEIQTYNSILEYKAPADNAARNSSDEIYSNPGPNSLKFNRIGIYAVKAAIRHFYKEGDAGCRASHYQVEISPDADPKLFAIMRLDEISMSDDASFGQNWFSTDFVLNLETFHEDETSICVNPEVYYNMVENKAITWYQNQLLATASLSEAVTGIGIDVAHLMARAKSGTGDCSRVNKGNQFNVRTGLKNLVDDVGDEGSVRDILSLDNMSVGVPQLGITSPGWECGRASLTVGEENATLGDYSINMTLRGAIDSASRSVLLMGGEDEPDDDSEYVPRIAVKDSQYSIIMSGHGTYNDVSNSIVMHGGGDCYKWEVSGADGSLLFNSGKLGKTTKFKNSFIHFGDSDIVDDAAYTYPSEFDNVVWIGSTFPLNEMSKRFEGEESDDSYYMEPLHDALVFLGDMYRNDATQGDSASQNMLRWLGRGQQSKLMSEFLSDALGSNISVSQPYSAPMMFTGGMALGGHSGISGMDDDMPTISNRLYDGADYYTPGNYGLLKLGATESVITDMTLAGSGVDLYTNTRSSCCVVGISADNQALIYSSKWVSGSRVDEVTTYPLPEDDPITESPLRIYSSPLRDNPNHFVVHSPHAGKPLVVAETQELDGTLHIGLGQDVRYGNSGTTSITTSYIAQGAGSYVGVFRLAVRYNNEHNAILQASWLDDAPGGYAEADWTDDKTDTKEAAYSSGPDENHLEQSTYPTYVRDGYSGVKLSFQYHWIRKSTTNPSNPYVYAMKVDGILVSVPSDKPNYYLFNGNTTGASASFSERVEPIVEIEDSKNITDTNIFIDTNWKLLDSIGVTAKFLAVTADRFATPFNDFDESGMYRLDKMISADYAYVPLKDKSIYRFSAVNYHQPDGHFVSNAHRIPLRMEKIDSADCMVPYKQTGYDYSSPHRVYTEVYDDYIKNGPPENIYDMSYLTRFIGVSGMRQLVYRRTVELDINPAGNEYSVIQVSSPDIPISGMTVRLRCNANYSYNLVLADTVSATELTNVPVVLTDGIIQDGEEFWIANSVLPISSAGLMHLSQLETTGGVPIKLDDELSTPIHLKAVALKDAGKPLALVVLSTGDDTEPL